MDISSSKPRVLLADNSERLIRAVSNILAEELEVVGSARNGGEAITAAIRLEPDVVVMDILIPKTDGIQATRRLNQMKLRTTIVLLTALEDQDFVDASLAAGASGFVFKSLAARDLPLAIHEALAGRIFVSTWSRE